MSAIRAALRAPIQTATDLLNQFEEAFAAIPDGPEKAAAAERLQLFHRHCSATVIGEGFRFVTAQTATGSPDEVMVSPASAGSGGK